MSTPEQRRELFNDTIKKLSLSQGHVARWMSLKNTKQTRESVSRKVRGQVGVTPKDVALVKMLELLDQHHYDLTSVEFSENGEILVLDKKGS